MNSRAVVVLAAALLSGCGTVGLKTREVPEAQQGDSDVAPEFTLKDAAGQTVSLADLLAGDRVAVLVFYRGHW